MCQTESKPIDIPTLETFRFITSKIPSGSSLLEVGCGAGHLAQELSHHGYRICAIDSHPEAIEKARALGVDAQLASWPEYASPPVDAVLFSRSLHHTHRLEPALSAARQVLEPSACLLVEDFAFRSAGRTTIEWFVDILQSAPNRLLVRRLPGELATGLLDSSDPEATWQESHGDHLHSFEAMLEAISAAFEIQEVTSVPYLYRYLVPVLPGTTQAAAWLAQVLRSETEHGKSGELDLVGRRVVAMV